MTTVRTVRIKTIVHAQAIRLPGDNFNSVQIDGLDENGDPVRVILGPDALKAMLPPVLERKEEFGLDGNLIGRATKRDSN